jgi:hypothetical protein
VPATNLISSDGTGNWGGLVFDVEAPAKPDLRVEVAMGSRMLVRQGDRPLLFARIADQYRGVHFLRAAGVRSPIAACRADRARALAEYGPDQAIARWAHAFAGDLGAAVSGPLHSGRWILTRHEGGSRLGHLRSTASRGPGAALAPGQCTAAWRPGNSKPTPQILAGSADSTAPSHN